MKIVTLRNKKLRNLNKCVIIHEENTHLTIEEELLISPSSRRLKWR